MSKKKKFNQLPHWDSHVSLISLLFAMAKLQITIHLKFVSYLWYTISNYYCHQHSENKQQSIQIGFACETLDGISQLRIEFLIKTPTHWIKLISGWKRWLKQAHFKMSTFSKKKNITIIRHSISTRYAWESDA